MSAVCIVKVIRESEGTKYFQIRKDKLWSLAASQASLSSWAWYSRAVTQVYISNRVVRLCPGSGMPHRRLLLPTWGPLPTYKDPALTKSKPGSFWTLTAVLTERLVTSKLAPTMCLALSFPRKASKTPKAKYKPCTPPWSPWHSSGSDGFLSLTFLKPESAFITPFPEFSLNFLKPSSPSFSCHVNSKESFRVCLFLPRL